MKNYNRYKNYSEKKYNKKSISFFLMKRPADKILIPYIRNIEKKKILEVGPGYGYYTKLFMENGNTVKGLDINPELGQNIGIEIIHGRANQLLEKINEKFDRIVSFWMTEYLNEMEMKAFVSQSIMLLNPDGTFVTTVIVNRGLGWLYIMLARMKGIQKYNYSEKQIREMIDRKNDINIIPLNTIFGIPFAFLIEVKANKMIG